MAPFRPTNVNKRSYPGNANVVGPTVATTLGFSTTTCCSSTVSCGNCTGPDILLGCRCTFCYRPCCNVCCSCPCTVCTPTVPSGMWSSFEQYEAKTRSAWDSSSSSSGNATCLCCTGVGNTDFSAGCVDCKGFFICCGPSTNKWFVSPFCTQLSRTSSTRDDAVTVANSCMGSCGWFIPQAGQLQNPGFSCRTYWDCYSLDLYAAQVIGHRISMVNGQFSGYGHEAVLCARSFRCTAS